MESQKEINMEIVQIKVLTISKKVICQLDRINDISKTDYDKIISGQWKILGKIDQDLVNWRNGTGWAILIQKEHTACLYPYFSMLRNQYPNIKSLVIL